MEKEMNKNEMIAPPPKGLTFLAGIEPEKLAAVLEKEDASVVSTVLVNLDEKRAVKVFNLLPLEFAAECACLMTEYSPVVVEDLAEIHSDILKKIKGTEYTVDFGNEVLIRLINNARVDRYQDLFDKIQNYKNDFVRDRLSFSFNDIDLLDPIQMQKLLYRADRDSVIKAFKGTDRNFRAKMLSAPSEYFYDFIRFVISADEYNKIYKEVDSCRAENTDEVLKAREELVQMIYNLEESGDIFIKRKLNDNDEIVD